LASFEFAGEVLRQVGAEIPIDSDDADEANLNDNGRTLLYVFNRGCIVLRTQFCSHVPPSLTLAQ
jgi:hypothetical protein